ncbi:MAG: heavy-metal-associated domain-containing protein [Agarilytica sp.]
MSEEHRPGVSEVTLVVRHLKMEPADQEKIDAVVHEIDEIYGVDSVSFDAASHVLNIAYDATRLSIECIEERIEKYALEISHDWWTHFKEGYYRFIDQNIQDNAKTEPWSCHGNTQAKPKRPKK